MQGETAMILKAIISVILLYYIAVLWQYFRHDVMRSFWKTDMGDTDNEPGEEAEKPDGPYTVIGKSTYRKRQRDEPEDKRGHAENQADKTDKFAAEEGEYVFSICLKNESARLSHFNHLTLQDARGEEINPVFWSDNFITLFPGDEKVITARVAVSDAGGVAPTFVLSR